MARLRPVAGSTETSRSCTVVQSRPAPNATLSARPPPSAAAPETNTAATRARATDARARMSFLRLHASRGPSFTRQLETEQRKCDEHREHADGERDDPPRVLSPLERLPPHLRPEHHQPADHACDHDQHRREHRGALERELEDPDRQKHEPGGHETRQQRRPQAHRVSLATGISSPRWTSRTTRPATTSWSSSSVSASASMRPISRSASRRPPTGSASWTTTSSTRRRPRKIGRAHV